MVVQGLVPFSAVERGSTAWMFLDIGLAVFFVYFRTLIIYVLVKKNYPSGGGPSYGGASAGAWGYLNVAVTGIFISILVLSSWLSAWC